MHSKPAAFFVPRLPFFFLFFPPAPLPLSLVKPVGRRHHRSRNLPLSPFSFPLSLSFLPFRHHQERRRWWQWWRTRAGGKKAQLVTIDGDNQQLSRSLASVAAEAKKNPHLIPKKIQPPFNFGENSSSFDFRENLCKTPKNQKKIAFFFAPYVFWICSKGLFAFVPLDLNFTNPKSMISGKIHLRLIFEKIHAKPPRKTKKIAFSLLPALSGSVLTAAL